MHMQVQYEQLVISTQAMQLPSYWTVRNMLQAGQHWSLSLLAPVCLAIHTPCAQGMQHEQA